MTSPDRNGLAPDVLDWLIVETHCSPHAARQAAEYVAAQQAAVAAVPTQATVVFERFFDDTGGMQLVVHAPFGARINKAWGLAMRKRFCRSFDFELQATADDDGFILSLGPQHSFPIESLFPMLRPDNVRNLLEQALLVTPTFHLRWRWNATRALQLERMRNGKKVPPALQRFRSQDLLTAVFPKLTGCQEEHTGDHIIPDHPLVQQTMHDCLHEALDIDALTELLGRVERGEITFLARDTREPSPFAYELLNSNPYAFLDGGEVQERRTRMAETQRHLTIESVRDLGRLDPMAITTVVDEAQPLVCNSDELHDLLQSRYLLPVKWDPGTMDEGLGSDTHPPGALTSHESLDPGRGILDAWQSLFHELVAAGRATEVTYLPGRRGWVATERWPAVKFLFPEATCRPAVPRLDDDPLPADPTEVGVAVLRGLMESAGPITAAEISQQVGLPEPQVTAALESLEGEGCVLRGHLRPASSVDSPVSSATNPSPTLSALNPQFSTPQLSSVVQSPSSNPEWCHRRLLQRIHRLTVSGLRKEIEPVDVATYFQFLLRHHGVIGETRREGTNGLFEVIGQLQGLDIPALAWEQEVLPQRLQGYRREQLDELCLTGEVGWGRLYPPPRDPERSRPMASITRVAPVSIYLREDLDWLADGAATPEIETLSSVGRQVLEQLQQRGAMFATDILAAAQLLPAQLDDVLGELVTRGFVTSDGFAGLRGLIRQSADPGAAPSRDRGPKLIRRRRATSTTGRWSVWRVEGQGARGEGPGTTGPSPLDPRPSSLDSWAWQLLRRWGVVFRDLLEKEPGAPPWWRLAPVLRRMEMRGEIRGGRFIKGVGGEQFASGEAVQALRAERQATRDKSGQNLVVLSAADPLNLVGIITPHARVPSLTGNCFALCDGVPAGDLQAGQAAVYPDCPAALRVKVLQGLGAEASDEGSTEPATIDRNAADAGGVAADLESPQSQEPTDKHARRFARRKRQPPVRPRFPRPVIS